MTRSRLTHQSNKKRLEKYKLGQRGLTFGLSMLLAHDLIMPRLPCYIMSLFYRFLFQANLGNRVARVLLDTAAVHNDCSLKIC